jgi:cell division initiation protein
MVTSQDVRAARFDKSFHGYRTEDVDNFLDKVTTQLEADAAQVEELKAQIQQLQNENQQLKQETATYEEDANMLKSALINAQRMGENVIREANQKSDDILHRANLRADDIVRDANELLQQATERADEIVNEAMDQKAAEEREYERVRLEVTRFKADVLNLYRNHVESLSRLPEYQKEEAAPAEEEEAPVTIPEQLAPEAEPKAEPEAGEAAAEPESAEPDFWEKDESELKIDPPPAAEDYAAFQGVKFSE